MAVACLALVLCGCKKDIQNQDAVRQGVLNYLSKRPGLLDMDVSVKSVSFRENEATAQVHFQAKGNSSPGAGMNMEYVLDRQGAEWVVRAKTGANAAHGANGPPPSAAPGTAPAMPPGQGTSSGAPGPLDGMPSLPGGGGGGPVGGSGNLPPGHPSVGSQSLPPGHPSVSPNSTNPQN
jgi:hypothetical protein